MDVPVARLGDGDEILSKYRNQVVPIVYGEVDKSPCVINNYLYDETEMPTVCSLLFDNKEIESFNEYEEQIGTTTIPISSLYFSKNDTYYNATKQLTGVNNFDYDTTGALINFETNIENLTSDNALGVIIQRKFVDIESRAAYITGLHFTPEQIGLQVLNGTDGVDDSLFEDGNSNAIDGKDNTFCLIKGLLAAGKDEDDSSYAKETVWLELKMDYFSDLDPATEFDEDGDAVESTIKTYLVAKTDHGVNYQGGLYNYWGIWYPSSSPAWNHVGEYNLDNDGSGIFPNPTYSHDHYLLSNDDYNSYSPDGANSPHLLVAFDKVDAKSSVKIGIPTHGIFYNEPYDIDVYFKLYHAFIYHEFKTKGIKDKDFYANINGRVDPGEYTI